MSIIEQYNEPELFNIRVIVLYKENKDDEIFSIKIQTFKNYTLHKR